MGLVRGHPVMPRLGQTEPLQGRDNVFPAPLPQERFQIQGVVGKETASGDPPGRDPDSVAAGAEVPGNGGDDPDAAGGNYRRNREG